MNELITAEQKTIEFYGDELIAIRGDDGNIYASVRHMCQALGIDDNGQRQRINRHAVLQRGFMVCKIHTIKGERNTHVLRADLVPLWLSGIRTSTVNEKSRPKLERFQEEAAKVLWQAFQEGRLTTSFDELLQNDTPAVQAYKMAQAIMELARNQILIESRLDNHQERLEQIEATLGDSSRHITPDQAMQISQAVKSIAIELGQQTKRNEFGAVYGELYRRYGVTSYKEVATHQYDSVMAWLNEWYQSLVSDTKF